MELFRGTVWKNPLYIDTVKILVIFKPNGIDFCDIILCRMDNDIYLTT